MPKYKYVARDREGNATTGDIQAADENELRRMLRQNDLYLTQAKGKGSVAAESEVPTPSFFDPKVTIQDMVIATRQLATTIRAGLPLLEALRIIGSQSNKPGLQIAFMDMAQSVSEGKSLSDGMKKHPKYFTNLILSLVEAGEIAGTLDQTLDIASDQLDREHVLRMKVKSATLYPKLVVLACVGTVWAMLTFVVPVFAKVYGNFGSKLPAATLLLMTVSDVWVHWWWLLLLVGVGAYFGYRAYSNTPGGRRRLDVLALQFPVLGVIFRKIAIARSVQTLSGALKGGVPVLQSLTISANTAGNVVIRDAILESARNVRDGASIAQEFERSQQFPLLVTRMLAAGEATGSVDAMLDEVNRFYERDIEYSVEQLAKLIEPVMTVAVGGCVLVILLALYMPIFTLGPTVLGTNK